MNRPGMTAPTALAALAALACSIVAACGSSAPVRYFTLDVAPAAAATVADPTRGGPAEAVRVQVGSVHIPESLDRRGLVHQVGPNRLAVADSDLWAAPLADLIRDTLAANLGQRLGVERVYRTETPTAARVVAVDFPVLLADASCSVTLHAVWTIRGPAPGASGGPADSSAELRGGLTTTAAATTCPEGLPAALSRALGIVSDRIAAALTTAPGS